MYEKKSNLKQYKKDKIQMLRKDFYINLTPAQERHLMQLPTEIAVDNFARTLFLNY